MRQDPGYAAQAPYQARTSNQSGWLKWGCSPLNIRGAAKATQLSPALFNTSEALSLTLFYGSSPNAISSEAGVLDCGLRIALEPLKLSLCECL